MIKAAQKNYDKFLVPTNFVESVKIKRHYTSAQQADLDIKTSVNKIGEIVNLSQELNTRMWDYINSGKSFEDVVSIYYDSSKLCIMSGIEIDSAKKEFTISNTEELRILMKKYNVTLGGRKVKPNFFAHVSKTKGYYNPKKKYYKHHKTAMDYVQNIVSHDCKNFRGMKIVPFVQILDRDKFEYSLINYGQINSIIDCVRQTRSEIKACWAEHRNKNELNGLRPHTYENFLQTSKEVAEIRQNCIDYIDKKKINYSTMYWILKMLDDKKNADIKLTMFSILFGAPNKSFYDVIRKSHKKVSVIVPDNEGDLVIFDMRYKRV